MRALSAAVLASTFGVANSATTPIAGQMAKHPHGEVEHSNMDVDHPPMYDTQNVSFSLMFECEGNRECWNYMMPNPNDGTPTPNDGTSTHFIYSGFNREVLREKIRWAMNRQPGFSTGSTWSGDKFTSISFDRIVEQTGALDRMFTCSACPTCSPNPTVPGTSGNCINYDGHWNVMVRVTVHDVPMHIAQDFMPVVTTIFGEQAGNDHTGTMGRGYNGRWDMANNQPTQQPRAVPEHRVKVKWDSVWISTQAYFVDDKLEPVVGRGRKSQRLLIPLVIGIIFMLAVPILVVGCTVAQQQALTALGKKLAKEEDKYERLDRDAKEKDAINTTFQNQAAAVEADAKQKASAAQKRHETELEPADVDWLAEK